jgi:hypothetical protein
MLAEEPMTRGTQPPAARPSPDHGREPSHSLFQAHPFLIVGGALAAGALVGLLRAKKPANKGMLRGLLGGLAMALVREAVLDRVSSYANSWIDTKSRDETASRLGTRTIDG